jgi:hypothetical protein
MGTAPIFLMLVAIVGVVVAIVVWLTRRSGRRYPGELRGIGGWLALFAIGVTLAPLRALVELGEYVRDARFITWETNPLLYWGEFIIMATPLPVTVWVAMLMFKKSRKFRLAIVYMWMLFVLLGPLDVLWVSVVISLQTGMSFQEVLEKIIPPDFGLNTIRMAAAAALWILYVTQSRRVANTFVS